MEITSKERVLTPNNLQPHHRIAESIEREKCEHYVSLQWGKYEGFDFVAWLFQSKSAALARLAVTNILEVA